MTPTKLASALRDVEIANEETNYAKFQSDCAIRDDAAKALESMTIECKDLEWEQQGIRKIANGVECTYVCFPLGGMFYWQALDGSDCPYECRVASERTAVNESNAHNKQRLTELQQQLDEWRMG